MSFASALSATDEDRSLVELARKTIDSTTDADPAEDGIHTMGAAVRVADGGTFVGVNIYHFTGGPCAETVARSNADSRSARLC